MLLLRQLSFTKLYFICSLLSLVKVQANKSNDKLTKDISNIWNHAKDDDGRKLNDLLSTQPIYTGDHSKAQNHKSNKLDLDDHKINQSNNILNQLSLEGRPEQNIYSSLRTIFDHYDKIKQQNEAKQPEAPELDSLINSNLFGRTKRSDQTQEDLKTQQLSTGIPAENHWTPAPGPIQIGEHPLVIDVSNERHQIIPSPIDLNIPNIDQDIYRHQDFDQDHITLNANPQAASRRDERKSIRFTSHDASSKPVDINDSPLFTISNSNNKEKNFRESQATQSSTPDTSHLDYVSDLYDNIEQSRKSSSKRKKQPKPIKNNIIRDDRERYGNSVVTSNRESSKPISTSSKIPKWAKTTGATISTTLSPIKFASSLYKRYNEQNSGGGRDENSPSISSFENDDDYESMVTPRPGKMDHELNGAGLSAGANHRSIILQQVSPSSPATTLYTAEPYSISSPVRIPTSTQHARSYTLQTAGSGAVKFLTGSDILGMKPLATLTSTQQYGFDSPAASHLSNYNRDLQNQPQTIQITALPNAIGNPNQIVRFNGQVGWPNVNNWFANQYGYPIDAFGQSLYATNAQRRQVDWPSWFYPIILIITLPLIVGALFVPVFLKTIIVLLQILQSLGLLLPLTSAMSQHLLQASGLTSGNSTALHFESTKTK